VRARAYYLAGYEPTLQSETERILQTLLSRPSLFRRTALMSPYKESQSLFRTAVASMELSVRSGASPYQMWLKTGAKYRIQVFVREPAPDFPGVKDNQVPFSRFIDKQRRCIVRRDDFDRVIGKSGRDGH
jgi:hypothetical protein